MDFIINRLSVTERALEDGRKVFIRDLSVSSWQTITKDIEDETELILNLVSETLSDKNGNLFGRDQVALMNIKDFKEISALVMTLYKDEKKS